MHGSVSLTLACLLALLVGSGMANEVDWTRRVGHVAIVVGLVWALGTGRVSLRSSALGLGAGLVSVIGLAVVGIGGDTYPGRLTGILRRPERRRVLHRRAGNTRHLLQRRQLEAATRTGHPDRGWAGADLLPHRVAGERLRRASGCWSAAGWVLWAERLWRLALCGSWQTSRRTSRRSVPSRTAQAATPCASASSRRSTSQLADMPWFGHGPGTAKVNIRGLDFFFHNSYLATRHEGGWLALLLVLLLLALAFVQLGRARAPRRPRHPLPLRPSSSASRPCPSPSARCCSTRPWAIAVGFALGHLVRTA